MRTAGSARSPRRAAGTGSGVSRALTPLPRRGRPPREPGEVPARPACRTTTRSAERTEAARCATSNTVRPAESRSIAARTAASLSASSPAVGSSRSSSGASRRKARARAIRCRCPADSPAPCSPNLVASPSGRSATKVAASAWRRAAHTSASPASGAPSRTLSATVPLNRYGRWGTQATWRRHCSTSRAARSVPPTRIVPDVGARKPSSNDRTVLFPDPLGPTRATRSPGASTRFQPVEHRPVAPGPGHGDRVQADFRGVQVRHRHVARGCRNGRLEYARRRAGQPSRPPSRRGTGPPRRGPEGRPPARG